MTSTICLFALIAFVGSVYFAYLFGMGAGRTEERSRVVRLITQSFQRDSKLSSTARRILHSVENNAHMLISEDEFFGTKQPTKPPPPCDHDPVPTSCGPFCSKCGAEL